MKRSDMIKIIKGMLETNGEHCSSTEEAADYMLTNLEFCGMLPPESEGKTLYGLFTDNRWDKE